jgi:hypothetical protein
MTGRGGVDQDACVPTTLCLCWKMMRRRVYYRSKSTRENERRGLIYELDINDEDNPATVAQGLLWSVVCPSFEPAAT